MMKTCKTLWPHIQRLKSDVRGSIATTFVVSSMGLITASGAALDYAHLSQIKTQLQAAADSAALAGAKEFRLGNANVDTVAQVAGNYAKEALIASDAKAANSSIAPSVDVGARTVTVRIDVVQPTYVMQLLGTDFMKVQVSATAKVTGGAPLCVIGLDKMAPITIMMDKSARLEASNCTVYSNSLNPYGLVSRQNAVLRAAHICSAGGKEAAVLGSFIPTPQLDCPVLADPLALRPQPVPGGCIATNLVLKDITTTLSPGTYCGGITLNGQSNVTLQAGIYIFKDGPLKVTGTSTLTGANVGLFMSGRGAAIDFEGPTTISLTAPKDGLMAGMLLFEDRASPPYQYHSIKSDNTRMLLGTIYLSRGIMHVAANKPVADQSAYTIVVARMFILSEGPTMVLNTNYSGTNIPVPAGLGPSSNRTALVN